MKHAIAAVAAVSAGALFAGAASAQSYEDWTGFSVGVVGGSLMTKDSEGERLVFDRSLDGSYGDLVVTSTGADAFSPGFCGGTARGTTPASGCDDDKDGFEGGVRAGYDMQWGPFVVGVLGEITGGTAEDSVTGFSTTPANYVFKRNLQGLAAARLRAGYAFGPALFYGTGGYAAGDIDNRFFTSNGTNSFTASTTEDDEADGWQAGGGVEYRLAPNLSVTGEYIYTHLDVDDSFSVLAGRGAAPATNPFILPPNTFGTNIARSNDAFRVHSVRIGMAYRF
jgi:outer membrane immunogenic protein